MVVVATFFTEVTMFKMLIVIMGDKFTYATDNREIFGTQTKLDLLSLQAPALRSQEKFDEDKVFMIVVSL